MKFSIKALLVIGHFSAFAGDVKYPVSSIAEELKKDVDIVVREDHMSFRIKSKNNATYYVHQVSTIFNERGNSAAKEIISYDKLSKVTDINAYIYNAEGKQIKRLKKSEIYDQASYDGITMLSDVRFKRIDMAQATYPYTVEIEYEIEYNFLFLIPSSWWGGERIAHEQASYQLIFPPDLKPRYKLFNIVCEP